MAQQLGTKFDHFAEAVLPSLIALIPNSAKVMASSGSVCIRFVMQVGVCVMCVCVWLCFCVLNQVIFKS